MNLILLLLLVHIVSQLVNPTKGLLTCGIVGYTGIQKINTTILRLLMIYSRARGTDSCGLWYNNERILGYKRTYQNDTSDSIDFVKGLTFEKGKINNRTVIAHTRRKSSGAAVVENIHPFEIKDNQGNVILVGCHNGTLNKDKLPEFLERWKLDPEEHDVDSYFLLKALAQNRNKMEEVLGSYWGTAAVMFSFTDTPNSLYVFRGESRRGDYQNAVEIEERPIHFVKTKLGVYFSSEPVYLSGSLNVKVDKVEELKGNTLTLFVDGENVHETKVDRSKVAQTYTKPYVRPGLEDFYPESRNFTDGYGVGPHGSGTNSAVARQMYRNKSKNSKEIALMTDIPSPWRLAGDKVYEWKFRYYRNTILLNGTYVLNKLGEICSMGAPGSTTYTFYEGYMVHGPRAIEELTSRHTKNFSAMRNYLDPRSLFFKGERDFRIFDVATRYPAKGVHNDVPFSYFIYKFSLGDLKKISLKRPYSNNFEITGLMITNKVPQTSKGVDFIKKVNSNIRKTQQGVLELQDEILPEEIAAVGQFNDFFECEYDTAIECEEYFDLLYSSVYNWDMSPKKNSEAASKIIEKNY